MRPTIRLRGSIRVAISIVAAFVPASSLIGQPTARTASPQSTTPVRVPQSTRRSDPRIAYIEALLDSAPGELAQSGNVLRAFGFASSDTTAAFRGMSIAVIDTTGARTALLLGDGSSIDGLPRHARRALATAAVVRGRDLQKSQADISLTTHRIANARDSVQLVIVRPVPRLTERCDCLLDGDGAIVAALSERGTAAIVTDDGSVAGTFVPLLELPAIRPVFGALEARGAGQVLRSTRDRTITVRELLALLAVGVGAALAWRLVRAGTRTQVLAEQLIPTSFDANTLLSSLAGEASEKLGRNTRLETHFHIAPAVVRGDRKRLAQALRLLIGAARHAMPRGGTLSLTTRFAEVTEGGDLIPNGHYIVLTVDDTGQPLPSDLRRRLLDAIPAPSREWSSASDDLTTVQRIVRAHGWWLHVDAPRDTGNVVSIYMPLAPESLIPLVDLQEELV